MSGPSCASEVSSCVLPMGTSAEPPAADNCPTSSATDTAGGGSTANAAGAAIREKLRAIRSGPSRPAIHPDAATAIEQACAAYFAQQEIALEGMEDPESEFEAPAEEDEEDGQVS